MLPEGKESQRWWWMREAHWAKEMCKPAARPGLGPRGRVWPTSPAVVGHRQSTGRSGLAGGALPGPGNALVLVLSALPNQRPQLREGAPGSPCLLSCPLITAVSSRVSFESLSSFDTWPRLPHTFRGEKPPSLGEVKRCVQKMFDEHP